MLAVIVSTGVSYRSGRELPGESDRSADEPLLL
jgi:hypothetical protein